VRIYNILYTSKTKDSFSFACLLLVMHHWAETRWKIKENQRNKMISLCSPAAALKTRLAARQIISTLWGRSRIKSDDRTILLITLACAVQFSKTGPLKVESL